MSSPFDEIVRKKKKKIHGYPMKTNVVKTTHFGADKIIGLKY